jgi:hypothetical protein
MEERERRYSFILPLTPHEYVCERRLKLFKPNPISYYLISDSNNQESDRLVFAQHIDQDQTGMEPGPLIYRCY